MRYMRILAAPALAVALLALPLQVLASHGHKVKHATCKTTPKAAKVRTMSSTAGTVIGFGISGGNILPWSITIDGTGSVANAGWIKPHNTKFADPTNTLNGLFTLANAGNFFAMPAFTNCTGTLPDVAGRYITMTSSSGSHKVTVHGMCVQAFNQLYGALENATDIQH